MDAETIIGEVIAIIPSTITLILTLFALLIGSRHLKRDIDRYELMHGILILSFIVSGFCLFVMLIWSFFGLGDSSNTYASFYEGLVDHYDRLVNSTHLRYFSLVGLINYISYAALLLLLTNKSARNRSS